MQIGKVNSWAFNGVNIVRVSKDVFKKDKSEHNIEFNDILCETIEKNNNFNLKDKLGLWLQTKKAVKIYDVLESPGYDVVCQMLPQYKPAHVDASWLSMHTKTPITLPESENYHKFYVLTGDEKNKAFREFGWLNCKKLEHIASKNYEKTNDTMTNTLRELAKLSQIIDERFHSIIDGKPIKEWKADSKEELEKITVEIYNQKN